jgi:hypothetical protein
MINQQTRILPFLLVAALSVASCKREREHEIKIAPHNLILSMKAYNAPGAVGIILNIRLFTFHDYQQNKPFSEELLNLQRSADQLSARVKPGNWEMVAASAPSTATLRLPPPGKSMEESPLYVYSPIVDPLTGRSSNADELFIARGKIAIATERETRLVARMDRNVAMLEVIVHKASANFDKAAKDHLIEIHRVPSTISYAGGLLPDKHAPDTLPAGQHLRARLILRDHPTIANYLHVEDTVRFLIPAHRGADYLAHDPVDTTTLKMSLSVNLRRTSGSLFMKSREIPLALKCNRVLRVRVAINDGLAFVAESLPWNEVDMTVAVGEKYANWLYVKRGESGSGQSWRDPLPDISSAISKATILQQHAIPVHGILVAGGAAVGAYDDSFQVPDGVRIFGGWSGEAGTELPDDDPSAPYHSAYRRLDDMKAIVSPKNGIMLSAGTSLLDGFVISDVNTSAIPLSIAHRDAWINAVEVRDNQSNGAAVLHLQDGVATNVLVADNSRGVLQEAAATVVNATIAGNAAPSSFAGALRNSVYWGNAGSPMITGAVQHSAFSSSTFAGAELPLNANNMAWFSVTDSIPGPLFNLSRLPSRKYAVAVADSSRSPLIGKGDPEAFDKATLAMTVKKDINGQPRHNDVIDIGCHENAGKGFRLYWDMEDIYVHTAQDKVSEHPVNLIGNSNGMYIKWKIISDPTVAEKGYEMVTGRESGGGDKNFLGAFHLIARGYHGNSGQPAYRGRIIIRGNVGAYLPDKVIDVYQSNGTRRQLLGHVGSFHRNNEYKARFVSIKNNGPWIVRVVNGVEWIDIDKQFTSNNNNAVINAPSATLSGVGDVRFRLGMRSILPPGAAPRYGLISVNHNNGVSLFFVRQGEEADYLFGPNSQGRTGGRPHAIKFSPFNLTDPKRSFKASGVQLGKAGGVFVDYPSQTGYFFKFSDTRAYYPDDRSKGTDLGSGQQLSWNPDNDPCPPGYRTPSNEEFVESYFPNSETNKSFTLKGYMPFLWGTIADGFLDMYAVIDEREFGYGYNRATEGVLVYNEETNASVYFPGAGKRMGRTLYVYPQDGNYVQWSLTRTLHAPGSNKVYTTHCYGNSTSGHFGMSCPGNEAYANEGLSLRCVTD